MCQQSGGIWFQVYSCVGYKVHRRLAVTQKEHELVLADKMLAECKLCCRSDRFPPVNYKYLDILHQDTDEI